MANKITSKSQLVEVLKTQLATNPKQIAKGILRIYEYQTSSEQHSKDVKEYNGVGFTHSDAYIMSSFAEQLKKGRNLSEKQLSVAKRVIPKYARQLIEQSLQKGLIVKGKDGYIFKKEEKKSAWNEASERRWIEYKNEYARLEAEQEQRAFESKMNYEISMYR